MGIPGFRLYPIMRALFHTLLFLISLLVGRTAVGQGVSMNGEKLTQLVDFRGGGITTAHGTYSTLVKAQLAGNTVVFVAYGGEELRDVGLFSADGETITSLLEVGKGATANDSTIRLGDFRDFGPDAPVVIPVVTQPEDETIRLGLVSDGSFTQIVGSTTVVPGSVDDQFVQLRSVVAHGEKVAFIGISRDERKGVYLYADGVVHDLIETGDPGAQLDREDLGDELIYDGESVHFFLGSDRTSKDLYSASLVSEPTLLADAFGQVNDGGVFRDYQTYEILSGQTGSVTFMAKVKDDSGLFRWTYLNRSDSSLNLVARSIGFDPPDDKSITLSQYWKPFFDGVESYIGGTNQLYGVSGSLSSASLLRVFPGNPSVTIQDLEGGAAVVMESASLPKRLWADLGIPGPVEIVTPPEPQVVELNGLATFEVTAEGLAPLTYEWYLNGELISFATSNSLSLAGISYDNVGQIRVVVRNEIDWDEAFASIDVSEPPEALLLPSDRSVVEGEAIEIPFQFRGQRPLLFEIVSGPPGHSLELLSNQNGGVFDLSFVTSGSVDLGDSGSYTLRVSNPSGEAEFQFNLSVGSVPSNPVFRTKQFELLVDHRDDGVVGGSAGVAFSGGVVFDPHHDRFLFPPLVGSPNNLPTIAHDGEVLDGVEGLETRAISNPVPVGFNPTFGLVFQGLEGFQDRHALYGYQEGVISTLWSATGIRNEIGVGPDFTRFEFVMLNDEICGLVDEGEGGDWSVVKVDDELVELVSSEDNLPFSGAGGFLGFDEEQRPLFHNGFEPSASNPGKTFGPVVYRFEPNGRITELLAGYLRPELIEPSREVSAIQSNTGIRFLSWGESILKIADDRLELIRVTHTSSGSSVFRPAMNDARASRFRVFFPALVVEDDISEAEFEEQGLEFSDVDSVKRLVLCWSNGRVEEVFDGRYLDGAREDAGGFGRQPLRLLNAVGDQLLLGGVMRSDLDRPFLMWNQAPGIREVVLSMQKSGASTFLDIPVGRQLQSSLSLPGDWTAFDSRAGSHVVNPFDDRRYFRVIPK